jgi:hypothetical protein
MAISVILVEAIMEIGQIENLLTALKKLVEPGVVYASARGRVLMSRLLMPEGRQLVLCVSVTELGDVHGNFILLDLHKRILVDKIVAVHSMHNHMGSTESVGLIGFDLKEVRNAKIADTPAAAKAFLEDRTSRMKEVLDSTRATDVEEIRGFVRRALLTVDKLDGLEFLDTSVTSLRKNVRL